VIEPVAVDAVSQEMNLRYGLLNSGSPSTVGFFGVGDPWNETFMTEEKVSAKTVFQLFADHSIDHCRLIKMDIQGAEYRVLESMGDMLERKQVDYLIVENNPAAYEGKDIRALFGQFGYLTYQISAEGVIRPVEAHQPLLPKKDYVFSHIRS